MNKPQTVNAPERGEKGFQKTHGLRRAPEYNVWNGMKHRCHNPNYGSYERYGARGISVCARWRNSFADFYADMGPRPSPQHSIERMDNDGDYEPGNCRWATLDVQANNKRRTIHVGGKKLVEIAAETGLSLSTVRARLYQGNADRIGSTEPLRRRDADTMNKGVSNGQAKMTDVGVRYMRALREQGWQLKDLAVYFGVSKSLAGLICRRERWGWLD